MEIGKRGIWILSWIVAIVLFAVGLLVGIVVDSGTPDNVVSRDELVELEERLIATITSSADSRTVDPQVGPWPYVALDVEEVRKLGHEGHHEGSCAYGSFNAIVATLQEEIGYPYDQIPTYMLHFGRGGVAGSGDVCGAVLGSLSAINLVAGEDYKPLATELIAYYQETPLPTDTANEYAVTHAYYGSDYIDERFVQTAAGDIACDASRGNWVATSGYDDGSPERHERCARLTGDVAAKAVALLNAWHAGMGEQAALVANPAEDLAPVFPEAEFTQVSDHVYEARRQGEVVGYVGVGSDSGHEGTIVMAAGVGLDGTVEQVHVIEQNETSGLGDVIAEDEFLRQFQGLRADGIRLQANDGEIEAVSGATVSCRSAVSIVRECVEQAQAYASQGD